MADAQPEKYDAAAAERIFATIREVMPPPPADPVEFPHVVSLALGVMLGRMAGANLVPRDDAQAAFWHLSQLTPPAMVAAIWPPE